MTSSVIQCPLCECCDHRELYQARDRHYGIAGTFRIVECSQCLLVFISPIPSEKHLSRLYPEDYYAYQDRCEVNDAKEIVKRLLGVRLGETKDPRFEFAGVMLDVGCGYGWFLRKMQKGGWTTFGVEVNRAAAQLGRDKLGVDIFAGTLSEAQFPSKFFDYIRSNHSFEHISSPNETLQEMYRVLKPSGKLMIGVPNIAGLNARIFKENWWYLGAPVHPLNYSVATLSGLLKKNGFRVHNVEYNSDYFGVLGSLQIYANRKVKERKSMQGRLIKCAPLKIVSHWTAKMLDSVKLGDCIEVTAVRGA